METFLWIVAGAALATAIMTGVGALPFLFVKIHQHADDGFVERRRHRIDKVQTPPRRS